MHTVDFDLVTVSGLQKDADLQRSLKNQFVAVTIGNFDGMHLGHQKLFAKLNSVAEQHADAIRVLMTFLPHPRRKLSRLSRGELLADPRHHSITKPRRKLQLAREFGFDIVCVARFNLELQQRSPESFYKQILKNVLHCNHIVIGDDWRFGKGRDGTAASLRELAAIDRVDTSIVSELQIKGKRVSSSAVRTALRQGCLSEVRELLNRPFGVLERVVHGEKRGRILGYPTANLNSLNQVLPPDGVYAGIANLNGAAYLAAISLGTKPMFTQAATSCLEVHLLDFDGEDFYGELLEVSFHSKLRNQARYESVEELLAQIARDCEQVRAILAEEPR